MVHDNVIRLMGIVLEGPSQCVLEWMVIVTVSCLFIDTLLLSFFPVTKPIAFLTLVAERVCTDIRASKPRTHGHPASGHGAGHGGRHGIPARPGLDSQRSRCDVYECWCVYGGGGMLAFATTEYL